jgi:hypothetical protein
MTIFALPDFCAALMRRIRPSALVAVAAFAAALPTLADGQEVPPPEVLLAAAPDSLVVTRDSAQLYPGVSPTGAFLRAVLLPGWGHASIGSYTRGGFYFAAEVTTFWGLMRTNVRLAETRDRAVFREAALRADLAAQGITDPDDIEAAVDSDEGLEDLNDLIISREDQQEDWAALGIFLLFLAGADAFVSAHLNDFPTPISLDAQPLPGGRMEISVGVKLPR